MSEWRRIDDETPKNREIMLWYKNWLGVPDMVVSGHWREVEGREFEATWEHSLGYGDADMWSELPAPPHNPEKEE